MTVAVQAIRQVLTYRGGEGQWSWVLHRVSGLGVFLFLALHIFDTSLVYFAPQLYEHAIALYRTWLFGLGEVVLVGAVILHGLNGLRIAILDFWPEAMEYQREMAYGVGALFLVLFVPASLFMLRTILTHL